MPLATPSRAIPSRALVERARPSRAVRREPAHIWRFGSDLYDRPTHAEATFGRISPATIVRGGQLIYSPEDVPSCDGQGIRIRPQATNLYGGGNRPGDWATAFYSVAPDNRHVAGWDLHKATASAASPASWNRLSLMAQAMDPAVEAGKRYVYSALLGGSSTGKIYFGLYMDASFTATMLFDTDKMTHNDGTSTGCTIEDVEFRQDQNGLYEIHITIEAAISVSSDGGGWGCLPSSPGDWFEIAHFQKVQASHFPGWVLNTSGTTQMTVTRTTEAADGAGNGLSIPLPDDMRAAMGGVVEDAVEPAFTLVYEFVAEIGSADIALGQNLNIGSFHTASPWDSPSIQLSSSNAELYLQCGTLGALNTIITAQAWDAGDRLKIVVGVDAKTNARLLGFQINNQTPWIANTLTYDAASAAQNPIGDHAYFCADRFGGDDFFPMSAGTFSFRPYLIDATQEAIINA